jgi:hypothetical protein
MQILRVFSIPTFVAILAFCGFSGCGPYIHTPPPQDDRGDSSSNENNSDPTNNRGVFETPAEDDEDWPEPELQGQHPIQWTQIRLGDDHYFSFPDPIRFQIQEGSSTRIIISGWDESGRSVGATLFQEDYWPMQSRFELPLPGTPQPSSQFTLESEDQTFGWFSKEGAVYDVKISEDRLTAAGKAEVTLLSSENSEEEKQIYVEFRGGFIISCSYRLSDVDWALDRNFESDFCQQFADLQDLP